MLSRYDTLNGAALRRLIANGTELISYDYTILKAAEEASFQLYEDVSNNNKDFRELYRQWGKFRKEVSLWNKINEFEFSSYVYNQGTLSK